MKIRVLNWINFVIFFLGIGIATINFCDGNILVGIVDIVVGIFNLFVFLCAVANAWQQSAMIRQKFTFTCKHCKSQFVPSFWRWLFVPHIFSKRYFKCAKCNRLSWMRRK